MDAAVSFSFFWLALTSALAFSLFGWDKAMARRNRRRVPERTLLALCALGGAAGGLIGMRLFHHKTRKPPFPVAVPLMLALHLALLFLLIRWASG